MVHWVSEGRAILHIEGKGGISIQGVLIGVSLLPLLKIGGVSGSKRLNPSSTSNSMKLTSVWILISWVEYCITGKGF